jgi:hypothetical protein
MVMTSLAWSLKAWAALLLPERGRKKAKHRAGKQRLLRMDFATFRNAWIQVPAQIIRTSPAFAARRLMLGATARDDLIHALQRTVREVPPKILALRIRELSYVNACKELFAVKCPAMHLRPSADRLVPKHCIDALRESKADLEFRETEGPHLILQRDTAWDENISSQGCDCDRRARVEKGPFFGMQPFPLDRLLFVHKDEPSWVASAHLARRSAHQDGRIAGPRTVWLPVGQRLAALGGSRVLVHHPSRSQSQTPVAKTVLCCHGK